MMSAQQEGSTLPALRGYWQRAAFACLYSFLLLCPSQAGAGGTVRPVFPRSPELETDSTSLQGTDPVVDAVSPPSYLIVTTTAPGFSSRTGLKPTVADGLLRDVASKPVIHFPDISAIENKADVEARNARFGFFTFPSLEYIKVSERSQVAVSREGRCLRDLEAAPVRVNQVHEFAGRYLLTLTFSNSRPAFGPGGSVQKIPAELVTDASMDPSAWERKMEAFLVCVDERQSPKLWPQSNALSFPEFKHGQWRKKVKIADLIPTASVSKEDGFHSYTLLLKLSVTVPWRENGAVASSETEVDMEQVDESGFDMEIFEQEDDNLQVEEFLFEIELLVRQPYHMALAVGLMRGSVCILKKEEERITLHCPVFDSLRERVALYRGRSAALRTRGTRLSTASLVSAGAAALGVGAILWGLHQPRKLRKKLNNGVASLVEYQLKQPHNSAVGDVTRMASPSNMIQIWKSRERNRKAAYGGIAEGLGFWWSVVSLSGALAGGVTKMKTVDVDRDTNEKQKMYLNKRLGAAADRAFELFRRGLPAAWRLIFVVSGPP